MAKLIILTEEMEDRFIELWYDRNFETPTDVLEWLHKRQVTLKNKIEDEIANVLAKDISSGQSYLRKELMKIFDRL